MKKLYLKREIDRSVVEAKSIKSISSYNKEIDNLSLIYNDVVKDTEDEYDRSAKAEIEFRKQFNIDRKNALKELNGIFEKINTARSEYIKLLEVIRYESNSITQLIYSRKVLTDDLNNIKKEIDNDVT